jgi:hypothetical protein
VTEEQEVVREGIVVEGLELLHCRISQTKIKGEFALSPPLSFRCRRAGTVTVDTNEQSSGSMTGQHHRG